MQKLILTNTSKLCLLDDKDFEYFCIWNWYISGLGYVYSHEYCTQSCTYIHIEILKKMGHKIFDRGDHIDRNPLNNQRNNLRPATHSENRVNSKLKSNNTSGYTGISYYKNRNKWRAVIMFEGKTYHIGYFITREEAIMHYNYHTKLIHGKFAKSY